MKKKFAFLLLAMTLGFSMFTSSNDVEWPRPTEDVPNSESKIESNQN